MYLVRLPSANRRLVRASIVDITERKRSEQALRDSEARYRGLVDNATYGILWVEEHGGRLLDANPAVAAMLRYDSVDDLLSIQFTRRSIAIPMTRPRSSPNIGDRGTRTPAWSGSVRTEG